MAIMEWKPICTVPRDRDVEIAVTDSTGMHALACPCRLTERGWIAAQSKKRFYWVRPTHWREWAPNDRNEESTAPEHDPVLSPLF
jgi:hypothetical protein